MWNVSTHTNFKKWFEKMNEFCRVKNCGVNNCYIEERLMQIIGDCMCDTYAT